MHSDLVELCRDAREQMAVPPFPSASIRSAAAQATQAAPRRRAIGAVIIGSLSLVAIAAAAAIVQRTDIVFTPSGGITVSSAAASSSRPIHSDAEIRAAASRLDFPVILPQGLPIGTVPIRLSTTGTDLMAVEYNLPGVERRSHHNLWILLANQTTMHASAKSTAKANHLTINESTIVMWPIGHEEVIVVSNGMTSAELATMKRAMSLSDAP